MTRTAPWGPDETITDGSREGHLDDRMLTPDFLDLPEQEVFRHLGVPYPPITEPAVNGTVGGGSEAGRAVRSTGRKRSRPRRPSGR